MWQCPRDELGGCGDGQGLPLPFRKERRQQSPTALSAPKQSAAPLQELMAGAAQPKARAALRCLLGGRRDSFIPSLQLHALMKNTTPFAAQQRNQSQHLLRTRNQLSFVCLGKRAQPCGAGSGRSGDSHLHGWEQGTYEHTGASVLL